MIMKQPKFEIDSQGFAQLQTARVPWRLAKEVVSNSYDEKEVTKIEVELRMTLDGALFIVKDDGLGFRDLRDAYTLYKTTPKRSDPTVRGVWNRGEKELLAIAKHGAINTTSGSVFFDGSHRQEQPSNRTRKGTVVTVLMDWTKKEMDEVEKHLKKLIPPADKTYMVNGYIVPNREPLHKVKATLETVLLAEDGLMRSTCRKTTINVLPVMNDEVPMLMEMGIPIQELDSQEVPWHLDVQQKVPLSPNRDSVRPAYLQDVLAEVLNVVAQNMTPEQTSATWVKEAIGDSRVVKETIKQVFETRFEGKAVIGNPLDPLAMERAQQAGMQIIHPRSLTESERKAIKETGVVQNVSAVYGLTPGTSNPYEPTKNMKAIEALVHRLAPKIVGHDVQVQFVTLQGSYGAAYCGSGTLTFVVNRLGSGWFDHGLTSDVLGLILHELSHELVSSGNPPHGQEFVEALGKLAGKTVLLSVSDKSVFSWIG